jgi:hypothetical protein
MEDPDGRKCLWQWRGKAHTRSRGQSDWHPRTHSAIFYQMILIIYRQSYRISHQDHAGRNSLVTWQPRLACHLRDSRMGLGL